MLERRLIEMLDSAEPEKRKTAIQQLARTKDPEAIRYLEATERGDQDASVREIARKAIAYIQRNSAPPEEASSAPATPPAAAPETPAEPATPPAKPGKREYPQGSIMAEYANRKPEPVVPPPAPSPDEPPQPRMVAVPESKQRIARLELDAAAKSVFENEPAKAIKNLVEAFKQNPNLQFDNYAVSLATSLSGLYKADAIKAVMDGSVLDLFDKDELQGKKKKEPEKRPDGTEILPATWGAAMLDLFMYGLINAVIVGALTITIVQALLGVLQSDPGVQEQLRANNTTMAAVIEQLAGYTLVAMLLYALLYGLFMIISLLLQSSVIHLIARFIMRGEGTLPNLIHRTALFLGLMSALSVAANIAAIILPIAADPGLGLVIGAVGFFLSLYAVFGYASRIGKAYDIGGGRGCLTLFLSSILLGLLAFAVIAGLMQIAGVTLDTLLVVTVVTP